MCRKDHEGDVRMVRPCAFHCLFFLFRDKNGEQIKERDNEKDPVAIVFFCSHAKKEKGSSENLPESPAATGSRASASASFFFFVVSACVLGGLVGHIVLFFLFFSTFSWSVEGWAWSVVNKNTPGPARPIRRQGAKK